MWWCVKRQSGNDDLSFPYNIFIHYISFAQLIYVQAIGYIFCILPVSKVSIYLARLSSGDWDRYGVGQ